MTRELEFCLGLSGTASPTFIKREKELQANVSDYVELVWLMHLLSGGIIAGGGNAGTKRQGV